MPHTHLSSGAGTIAQLVGNVWSALSLTPPHFRKGHLAHRSQKHYRVSRNRSASGRLKDVIKIKLVSTSYCCILWQESIAKCLPRFKRKQEDSYCSAFKKYETTFWTFCHQLCVWMPAEHLRLTESRAIKSEEMRWETRMLFRMLEWNFKDNGEGSMSHDPHDCIRATALKSRSRNLVDDFPSGCMLNLIKKSFAPLSLKVGPIL
jgi:hypothetical protein